MPCRRAALTTSLCSERLLRFMVKRIIRFTLLSPKTRQIELRPVGTASQLITIIRFLITIIFAAITLLAFLITNTLTFLANAYIILLRMAKAFASQIFRLTGFFFNQINAT